MGAVFKDTRSGSPIWAIRYTDVDGRKRKERTKATTRSLARRILAEREEAVERARLQGLRSLTELTNPIVPVTIRKFSEDYEKHFVAQCTKSTATRYKSILRSAILPRLGSLILQHVNPGQIQKYADERLMEAAPATVRQELHVISAMYREAMKQEILTRNPVKLVTKPQVSNEIVRYLSDEEEERLLAFAPPHLEPILITAIYTGLRDSELRNLVWADVRFKERKIVVRNTKSKRDRAVDMCNTVFETLEKLPRHIRSPYVFTNPATETMYVNPLNNTAWDHLLIKTGIQKFRFHDLRHTFGSRLAQRGVPLPAIKDLMGHSSITVTMRYAHMAPSDRANAVRLLDQKPAEPKPNEKSTHGSTHAMKKAVGDGVSASPACNPSSAKDFGGPGRTRTDNQGIMSPLL